MKTINENNVYKELITYSIKLNRLDNIYKKNVKSLSDSVLIKYKGFPKILIEDKVKRDINSFGKTLFEGGNLNLTKLDIIDLFDNFKVSPIIRARIINFESDDDDDYDRLEMFDKNDFVIREIDYRENYNSYKKSIEKFANKRDNKLSRGLDNKNQSPKPKNN
jgi:hypothetical protein